MAQPLQELPLFALNTVLFPFATLLLHVFEPRYRDLVDDCLAEDKPFGVVLIRQGNEVGGGAEPYLVGTYARITDVQRYEDGRMDIRVQGEGRFRIRQLDEDRRSYLVGHVETVQDLEPEFPGRTANLVDEARSEFESLIRKILAPQEFHVDVRLPPDPVTLSFTIANMLSMGNIEKQRLLETTDTHERLEELMPVLQTHLEEATARTIQLGAADVPYYEIEADGESEWETPN